MELKVCTKCNEELSFDKYGKAKRGKFGLSARCLECERERVKEYHKNNKEKIAIYSKQYRNENKDKVKERSINYKKANKEKISINSKIYTIKNKDKINEYCKTYREENPEKRKASCSLWQRNNRDKYNTIGQNYRAKKHSLPFTLTIEQWLKIKVYFNNECAYCGKELPLEQEHFLALSKNGECTNNNIICACRSCNASKSNKDFFEWYPEQTFYSKQREKKILKYLHYENKIQQLALII